MPRHSIDTPRSSREPEKVRLYAERLRAQAHDFQKQVEKESRTVRADIERLDGRAGRGTRVRGPGSQ